MSNYDNSPENIRAEAEAILAASRARAERERLVAAEIERILAEERAEAARQRREKAEEVRQYAKSVTERLCADGIVPDTPVKQGRFFGGMATPQAPHKPYYAWVLRY